MESIDFAVKYDDLIDLIVEGFEDIFGDEELWCSDLVDDPVLTKDRYGINCYCNYRINYVLLLYNWTKQM